MLSAPIQTTLEEGVPLREVTFVVVDLETTGGSPRESSITEIGAVRVTGGERIGTFHALINPGEPIPPYISHLTGIDDFLVREEPPIEAVLPAFLEFARGAIFVAHNARFDFSFLNEDLGRLDYPLLEGPPVCTAKLARRVVWPDVPNVRLQTLAQYFRTRVKPTHRALDDALACAEVLDGLIDLGGRLGILTLGDLREAVRARGRPHFGKIRLADALPHEAGVYRFVGRDGRVLYVGKARDLRARVKSYFYGDGRKKVENLLGEVRLVEGEETPGGELEALVLEARLIRQHEPKYNRRGKTWRRFAYLKLDPSEAYPRLKVVHRAGHLDGCVVPGAVLGERGCPAREGGAGGGRAAPSLHPRDERSNPLRGVRPRRHRPLSGALRRPDRPRALRRARPGPPLLPRVPGRAPRSARGEDGAARGYRAIRGGRLRPRPPPGAGGGASPSTPGRMADRREEARARWPTATDGSRSWGARSRGRGKPQARRNRSPSPARASAPTSSPRSAPGSPGTPFDSSPATSRSRSPSTAVPASRGSSDGTGTPSCPG